MGDGCETLISLVDAYGDAFELRWVILASSSPLDFVVMSPLERPMAWREAPLLRPDRVGELSESKRVCRRRSYDGGSPDKYRVFGLLRGSS